MPRFRPVAGNRITLLKNGEAYFPELIAAIDAAVADVRVETYIFQSDETGRAVAESLKRAARRGAMVRVLVDGVGSWRTPPSFFQDMRAAGVTVLFFRPVGNIFRFSKSRLRRVHRKVVLVDGRVGFVGGINLVGDLTDSLSDFPRYDYAVKVEGPLLHEMYLSVQHLWRIVAWWNSKKRNVGDVLPAISSAPVGDHAAIYITRDNLRHRRDIEHAYLAAIRLAKREILLVSPYFLPGRRFRKALMAAAKRGVTVTLLMQGRGDHPLLLAATSELYAVLLTSGVRIYAYEKSMLHGKVAVIDDAWATVGSSNLDPFSLFLNREANIAVLDAGFVRALRASVMMEIDTGAVRLDAQGWGRRSWLGRMKSWCAYAFARWVAGVIGYAKKWE